jgi:SAM-dependent methyltransferase
MWGILFRRNWGISFVRWWRRIYQASSNNGQEKDIGMNNAEQSDNVENKHHHGGKFSEGLLDTEVILHALNIQPGQVILDAGCGNGYMSKAFSSRATQSGKVYALDIDKYFIERLRKETQNGNIETIAADITQPIQIAQGTIDLVYISTVIHGFSRQQLQDFLSEARRMLKPNGILAIVEIEKKETPFGPPVSIRFSPDDLKKIVPMQPLQTIPVGPHFYMQMFRN